MASHFFLVFIFVILTVANGISAADSEKSQSPSSSKTLADNKPTVDNSTKSLIDSLGPSQDYPDYEIPLELAPDGVVVVGDYAPISPRGTPDTLAQSEADQDVKTSTSSSASRSSSTVLAIVVVMGGASLFFF
ncbi:unnamed protein product [Arabidopsis thaliana]|uniref:Transmembrane protein n=2 Tax=Arabidopsis thaliana TaxID=3702 RepID=Q9LTY9_ARATH|nr:uncharacterized protein AT3G27410 [Arabidopsis thaliana]AAY78759.1 unknown [Arabidopsis thaliana]AEE77313.1 transmembrane protein [Arabidopsis thaliana]BAA95716.1 unnamed protein product [Arabidopsis thaliana]CAA0383874.1 unnamed protein product [Arabidopsis thaliana]|eukprot:NP_189377.1 transmembrane protein [Arabidopsis thaliana]